MNRPRTEMTPAKASAPKNEARAPAVPEARQGLVQKFAGKLGVEPEKMLATLRATAFRTGRNEPAVTNEEMLALLVVANEFNLNPFLKEIYAFRDQKGGVIPVIGIDGWVRLLQNQPDFEGMQFAYADDGKWVECTIHRSKRKHPFTVREYLDECQRDTGPWRSHPRRMLRHRALAQCARVAYGFGGAYDPDEGETIAVAAGVDLLPATPPGHTTPPQARTAEEPFATDDQLEQIRERLGVTGVPDNLVLAKFEIGDWKELRFNQVEEVLAFIANNAP